MEGQKEELPVDKYRDMIFGFFFK